MEFNINNYVMVKLTDEGREALKKRHKKLHGPFPKPEYEYIPPVEDKDGWSKWQLWELMGKLGDACYNGCHVPFETTIRLEN